MTLFYTIIRSACILCSVPGFDVMDVSVAEGEIVRICRNVNLLWWPSTHGWSPTCPVMTVDVRVIADTSCDDRRRISDRRYILWWQLTHQWSPTYPVKTVDAWVICLTFLFVWHCWSFLTTMIRKVGRVTKMWQVFLWWRNLETEFHLCI